MILDARKDEKLPTCLPSQSWGSIVLSSPNKRSYKVRRETNTDTKFFFINRHHAREMKTYFAWMQRADLATAEGNAALLRELEKSRLTTEERMRAVGHVPRYVFDESYKTRRDEAEVALAKLVKADVSRFLDVFAGGMGWKDGGTAHSLVDLVRLVATALMRTAGTGLCLRRRRR
ncbi:hypothetical protein TRVL_08898 [Trypanosoma vivax]|nr:hypothetical protein TRVL_08898 [Trypanosoma vivax]